MKNKKLLSLFTIVFVGFILGVVSIFFINEIDKIIAQENNISISDNIAIVNQDLGIGEDDKYINYSEKIIETLDDRYVLTSREAAKVGMENGSYSAMIIFPGTFSENVVSINKEKPDKAQFYYETSKVLSKEKQAQVEKDILSLERETNDKLSYLYIANILNEFHSSQDKVEYVLANDSEDLESINSINDNDLIKAIDLREIEKLDIDIDTLDFTKDFEVNENIMKEMDSKYKEYLSKSESDLNDIKIEGNKLISSEETGILTYQNNIDAVDVLPKYTDEDNTKYKDILDNVSQNKGKLIDDKTQELLEKQEEEFTISQGTNIENSNNAEDKLIKQTDDLKKVISLDIDLSEKQQAINNTLDALLKYANELTPSIDSSEIIVPNIYLDTLSNLEKLGFDVEDLILEATRQVDEVYTSMIDTSIKTANVLREENKINALISEVAIKSIFSRSILDNETIKSNIVEVLNSKIPSEINFEIVKESINSKPGTTEPIENVEQYVDYILFSGEFKQYANSMSYGEIKIELPKIEDVKVSDKIENSIIHGVIKTINTQLERNIRESDNIQSTSINEVVQEFSNTHIGRYNKLKDTYKIEINNVKTTTTDSIEAITDGVDGLLYQLNEDIGSKNINNQTLLDKMKESLGGTFGWFNDSLKNINDGTKNKVQTNTEENRQVLKRANIENENTSRDNIRSVEANIKKDLSDTLAIKHNELELLQEDIRQYNPIQYITKNQSTFDNLIKDYDKNNKNISSQIKEQDNKNIKFTEDTYKRADEHVEQLREDVLKTKEESESLITEGLKNTKKLKQENTNDNTSKMGEFTSKLPYTRVGTLDNTYMYDFIATPIQVIDTNVESDVSTQTFENEKIIDEYKIYIIAALIVVIFAVIVIYQRKINYTGDKNE